MDDKNNIISWTFLKHLLDSQVGLYASNKHLNFKKEMMKISLDVQVLSNRVVVALDYMNKDLKIFDFKTSEHTTNFCRIIFKTFDILRETAYVKNYGINCCLQRTKTWLSDFLIKLFRISLPF